MRQVLFWIPIPNPWFPQGIPIYGFGLMLFLTFVSCVWLAGRRAKKEGINPQHLADLAIWIFVGGIIGARITYMIQYGIPIEQFFRIWEGGLVFYGSAIGGVAGYALAYLLVIRKHGLNTRQLADIIAPTVAWGLMLGRIGCLLNGCCFGHVSCTDANCSLTHMPPALTFPLHSPPWMTLVGKGYQTSTGFSWSDRAPFDALVGMVEPDSAAAAAGLQPGDLIVKVNGDEVHNADDLEKVLSTMPRGQTELALTVLRNGEEVSLPPFTPRTLGLHPTQLYEAISMLLLFLLLHAYYPFRRHYGEVFVLLILCYTVHRFVNEMLRDDTKPVVGTGSGFLEWVPPMTLSMAGSVIFLAVGIGLFIWLWRQPADPDLAPKGIEPPKSIEPQPAG